MPRAIWIALAVNTLVYSAHRGSKVVMALAADAAGASAWDVGLIASLYGLVPAVLAFVSGCWSDRFGARALLMLGCSVMAFAVLLPSAVPAIVILVVAATLIGTGHIVYQVAMQNAIGQLSEPQVRVKHYAAYSLTVALATVAGPFVAAIAIDRVAYEGAFLLLGATACGGLLLIVLGTGSWRASAKARSAARATGDGTSLLALPALRRVIVVSALVNAAYDLFSFYLPLHARAAGLSASTIGIMLAFFGAAGVAVRIALPALVQRFGDERLLLWCLLLSGIVYAAIPLSSSAATLCLLCFLVGTTLGCCPTLLVPMTYARAPEGRSGEALGLRLSASYGAHATVPAALGGLGTLLGIATIFWSNAALLALGVLYLIGGSGGTARPMFAARVPRKEK